VGFKAKNCAVIDKPNLKHFLRKKFGSSERQVRFVIVAVSNFSVGEKIIQDNLKGLLAIFS